MAATTTQRKPGRKTNIERTMIGLVEAARMLKAEQQTYLDEAAAALAKAEDIEAQIASLQAIHQQLDRIRVAKEEGRLK